MTHTIPINQVTTVLQEHPLCNSCLGRLFREHLTGSSNKERGEHLRTLLKEPYTHPPTTCDLCENLLAETTKYAYLIEEKLKNYEYTTFLIGAKIDQDILEKEQQLWTQLQPTNPEPLKMEINREVGKILEQQLHKTVDFTHPDITAIIDTTFDAITLQITSLYIYGRYNKFERGIPQTKWPCRICRGKGCKRCNNTGKQYPESVEELIATDILDLTHGTSTAFHGSGREDIDARMLGNGRPFVLEIKNPQTRTLDFTHYQQLINTKHKNKIQINNLRYSTKEEILRLKNAEFHKTYRILIESEAPFQKEKLKKAAQTLRGTTIKQFTPTRVAHRRAEKTRERTIYNCTVESVEDALAVLTLETESGTYIKELISGDQGRTNPNLSDLLNTSCKVKELDVIEIKGE